MKDIINNPEDPVSLMRGIGPHKAAGLKKIGILTIEDLLYCYPRDYEDRRNIKTISGLTDGETALLRCRVDLIVKGKARYGKKGTLRLLVSDESGSLEVIFFNAAYIENTVVQHAYYSLYGKISITDGRIQMLHPDFAKWEEGKATGIRPIYNLTQGISQKDMRKWIDAAMKCVAGYPEYLPEDTRERNRLCDIHYALTNMHFPSDGLKLKEAKYRLIFEELLMLQTGLMLIRNGQAAPGKGIPFPDRVSMTPFVQSLPYQLTKAQSRVLIQVNQDMEAPRVMSRLIQGDVGSGKTVLAAAAIYKAVSAGYQTAMMAPTELLARQHYHTMRDSLKAFGFKISFLSGSIAMRERKKILEDLESGAIDLLIGTHAVIQSTVKFNNLGLVITDEQHRFGVAQRTLLTKKGANPDILVMTATPIPRTLALILYGDLDISILDELPPGRREIITRVMNGESRALAYAHVREELKKGRQAYVVAPLIEDSDNLEAKSATSLYEELAGKFKGFQTALLHGELPQADKDDIMQRFHEGAINLLISTVVIEVGINVPNATCMLIENAERFGLSQLHQLRGRVGRAEHQSACFLITDSDSGIAAQRTRIMEETNDGFIIADKDLELRGPGEFFGTRQHGVPELKIANLIKHIKILDRVKKEAVLILESDPDLSGTKNAGFKSHLKKMFETASEFVL